MLDKFSDEMHLLKQHTVYFCHKEDQILIFNLHYGSKLVVSIFLKWIGV